MMNLFKTVAHVVRRRAMQVSVWLAPRAPLRVRRAFFHAVCRPHAVPYRSGVTPIFEAVYFELRTRCNGSCNFCAASVQNDQRKDIQMSRDLFESLVNQLKDINYSGRVCFHVNNDPLIVSSLEDFVIFARQALPQAYLQILSNGRALRNPLGKKLLDAGIDEMTINWYVDDPASALPANLAAFRDDVVTPFLATEAGRNFRFSIHKRSTGEILTNRGGTAPNKRGLKDSNPYGFCVHPFTQMNITADGKVSKCCSDVFFSDVMGDLTKQSLLEVWRGQRFAAVRTQLLDGDRSQIEHCRACDFAGIRTGKRPSWGEQLMLNLASQDEEE
jgi:radical SAM protein with 4Fe4S-binding SPASM domain